MSDIDRTFLTVGGREPCEDISFAVASGPVLTIKPDGELVFGENAHPQEAVDILMRVWRQTVNAREPDGWWHSESGQVMWRRGRSPSTDCAIYLDPRPEPNDE